MKCVMCNYSRGGVMINGIHTSYKLCKECLIKYAKKPNIMTLPNNTHKQNETLKTRQRKAYIQEEVDKKLDKYLLEV